MVNVSEELSRLAQLRDQGVLTQEEFEAQKAAVLRGETPAAQPAADAGKKPSMGKSCLILIVALIVVAIAVAILGGGSGDSAKTEQEAAARPAVEVTAAELFNAYQANEAAAQQKYGDGPLLVTGMIDGIALDVLDKPVVKLRTPNQFMSAQASLVEADQPKASGLSQGETIKLRCASVSEVVGTPMLRDCAIQ